MEKNYIKEVGVMLTTFSPGALAQKGKDLDLSPPYPDVLTQTYFPAKCLNQ